MQGEENSPTREQRRAEIRAAKRRKLQALGVLAFVLLVVLILTIFIARAVKDRRDAAFKQMGPFPPEESVQVVRIKKPYDFDAPVPEAPAVGDSRFSTALIVGDSRVEGMSLYLEACPAELWYSQSMTAQSAIGADGTPVFAEKLAGKDAVYLVMGLNEMGWSYPELFQEYLDALIKATLSAAPGIDIYVTSPLPLTASTAAGRSYMTAELAASMKSMAKSCAAGNEVYYLDLDPVLCGEDGWLLEGYAEANGISLNQSGYQALYDHLKTHVVDKELYL